MGEQVRVERATERLVALGRVESAFGRVAGVAHDDVDAAEHPRRQREGTADLLAARDVRDARDELLSLLAADLGGHRVQRVPVAIAGDDVRAELHEERGRRAADAGRRARDERDLLGQRKLGLLLDLGLLEAPVLDVEEVSEAHRGVATDVLGVGDDLDRVLVDVGGDLRLLLRLADGEDADARNEDDARPRVELRTRDVLLRAHLLEVAIVAARVFGDLALDARGESVRLLAVHVRDQERRGLGPDHMVGSGAAALDELVRILALEEPEDPFARTHGHDRRTLVRLAGDVGDRAAYHRGDGCLEPVIRGAAQHVRGLHAIGGEALGDRDGLDHALVALLGGLAEGEDSVALEHHDGGRAACNGRVVPRLLARLRETEARHDVGHPEQASAEELAADALASLLVGDREDGVRMRVIDEASGERGVEERLDARRRRVRIEEREPHLVDHLLVGHRREREHALERSHPDRGVARRLDRREVPARALHVDDGDGLAEERPSLRFHAGVAASVENERVVSAEEPGGIGAQRDELADGRNTARAFRDRPRGIRVHVATVHRFASYQLQGSGG